MRRLSFPVRFLEAFPLYWLLACLCLVGADIFTKKWITNNLNFHLNRQQLSLVDFSATNSAIAGSPEADQRDQISILGAEGRYIKFRLVFNDRFVFGLGPSLPLLGFFISFFGTVLLVIYRWYNPHLGHTLAWLFVLSGAVGNLIDKLFLKSLSTREWAFSIFPRQGYVRGVVDFVECIWFGWEAAQEFFLLRFLSMSTWPTFNLADSMIVVGIALLLPTIWKGAEYYKGKPEKPAAKSS